MSKQIPGLLESLKRKHYYELQAQGEEEDLKGSVSSLVLGEYLGSPVSSAITLLFAFKLLMGKQIPKLALTQGDAGQEPSILTTTEARQSTNDSPEAKTLSPHFCHQPVKFRPMQARG